MFITITKWIDNEWNDVSAARKKIYGSKAKFTDNLFKVDGFQRYLNTLKGLELDRQQMNSLATAYFRFGRATADVIHMRLAWCCRDLNIELPAVAGCLTEEYWTNFFKKKRINVIVN